MNRSCVFVTVLVAGVIGAGSVVFGELTAGQKQAAEVLIKDFGAKEFAARQAAVEKLIAFGPDVVPLIRKTLAETADAEVKLRCQMVLKGVAEKFGVTAEGPKPEQKLSLDASKITLDVKDAPLGEVLGKLAEESGNALIRLPGELEEKTVTLSVKDAPYWEVLDKLCEATGSIYQVDYTTGKGGLTLIATAKANDVGGTNGPVSVRVNSITKMRTLRPFGPGQQPTGSLQCQMVFFWEDRLPVVSAEGFVTKATLPDGRVLVQPAQPAQPMGAMMFRAMRMGGTQKMASGNIFYQTTDLGEGGEKLSSLEGVVRLTAAVGPDKQLKVDDVLGEGEKTAEGDGLTLTVTQDLAAKNANPGNPDAPVQVQLNLKATRDGNPARVPIDQLDEKYGVFLIDPAGNRHTPQGFRRGAGIIWGGVGNDPRVIQLQPGVAGNVVVVGGPGNDAQTVALTFFNLPKMEGKWSLLVVWPGNTETKEYPFTIKDVPLP